MQWDFKNQLHMVDLAGGGTAYYVYDANGQRVRKVVESGSLIKERIYLGGYEIYRKRNGSGPMLERETLNMMDHKKRIALVETKTVDTKSSTDLLVPLIRYQFDNHLSSAVLELDAVGAIISYEEFYPYGSTSYQAGRNVAEVNLKRYRYTGKERDEETGLYYHGARYYAPWLGRWVSTDRKGVTDSVDLYSYGKNNPIHFVDPTGNDPVPTTLPVWPEYEGAFRELARMRREEDRILSFEGPTFVKPQTKLTLWERDDLSKDVKRLSEIKFEIGEDFGKVAINFNRYGNFGGQIYAKGSSVRGGVSASAQGQGLDIGASAYLGAVGASAFGCFSGYCANLKLEGKLGGSVGFSFLKKELKLKAGSVELAFEVKPKSERPSEELSRELNRVNEQRWDLYTILAATGAEIEATRWLNEVEQAWREYLTTNPQIYEAKFNEIEKGRHSYQALQEEEALLGEMKSSWLKANPMYKSMQEAGEYYARKGGEVLEEFKRSH